MDAELKTLDLTRVKTLAIFIEKQNAPSFADNTGELTSVITRPMEHSSGIEASATVLLNTMTPDAALRKYDVNYVDSSMMAHVPFEVNLGVGGLKLLKNPEHIVYFLFSRLRIPLYISSKTFGVNYGEVLHGGLTVTIPRIMLFIPIAGDIDPSTPVKHSCLSQGFNCDKCTSGFMCFTDNAVAGYLVELQLLKLRSAIDSYVKHPEKLPLEINRVNLLNTNALSQKDIENEYVDITNAAHVNPVPFSKDCSDGLTFNPTSAAIASGSIVRAIKASPALWEALPRLKDAFYYKRGEK